MGIGDWKQKKYKTWDDAFRGLAPVIRQQSVRAADYAQVLFAKACEMPCYIKGSGRPHYLYPEFAEVAYKCGLYHQIGKAMLPAEQQVLPEDADEETIILYRTYTTEGRDLVTRLQGTEDDKEEVSLSCLMIREACEQHMERWDGSGYPQGREREHISLIAQIVSLAKELDHMTCEILSENPFDEAVGMMIYRKGAWFSENLIETMKECRNELREIYHKYIQYTRTVPKTIPLVEMRAERPFGLKYRDLVVENNICTLYEAVPWFRGVAEEEGHLLTMKQVDDALSRTGLLHDVAWYFLYEAADAVLRLQNWGCERDGILVPMFSAFYREMPSPEKLKQLDQLFTDQPIERRLLKLTIPCKHYSKAKPYLEKGIVFVLDEYHPDRLPAAQIQEEGFAFVRISKKITDVQERETLKQELQRYGITVLEKGSSKDTFSEEEMIRRMRERIS